MVQVLSDGVSCCRKPSRSSVRKGDVRRSPCPLIENDSYGQGLCALVARPLGYTLTDRERCPDAAGYSCWSGRLAPCCGAAPGLHVMDRRGAHGEELGGLDLAQGGVLLERPQHDVPVKIPLATNRRRERRDHRVHL